MHLSVDDFSSSSLNVGFVDAAKYVTLIQERRLLGAIHYARVSPAAVIDEIIPPHITAPMLPEATATSRVIEAWVVNEPVRYGDIEGWRFGETEQHLFACLTVPDQNRDIESLIYKHYLGFFTLLDQRGYGQLLRSWTYLPRINAADDNGRERYRSFCAGRARAFAEFYRENEIHMPAATGIGSHSGNIVIAMLARREGPGLTHIENPRQTPAYYYPKKYGPCSPSFARATAVMDARQGRQLFISGTAAVVGSESQHAGDTRAQLLTTFQNLMALIGSENLYLYGIARGFTLKDLRGVKVYIRHSADFEIVRELCDQHFSDAAEILYLHGDICRQSLDVEIEGFIAYSDPVVPARTISARTISARTIPARTIPAQTIPAQTGAYTGLAEAGENALDHLLAQMLSCRSQPAYSSLNKQGEKVKQISFTRLHHQVLTTAAMLQQRHPNQQAVLLLLEEGIDFVVYYLACIFAGLIAVPVAVAKGESLSKWANRLQHSLADLQLSAVLYTDDPRLLDPQQRLFTVPCHNSQITPDQLQQFYQFQTIDPDRITTILYTSGSVAEPKGVPLTHRQLITCALDNAAAWHYDEQTVSVSWMSHAHSFGLVFNVLLPLFTGSHCVLLKTRDFITRPLLWLTALSRYQATHTAGAVFGYDLLLKWFHQHAPRGEAAWNLSALKLALISAENIHADTFQQFQQRLLPLGARPTAFCPVYGLSEAGPITCKPWGTVAQWLPNPTTSGATTLASVGTAVGAATLVCVAPGSRTPVADGQVGEVCIAGGSVIAGYWKKEETNQRLFRQTVEGYANRSFFRTGDLGFLHKGQLYLVGRLKEMIIVNGQNHYPVDIEAVVRQAVPGLQTAKAAAFAVSDRGGREHLYLLREVPATVAGDENTLTGYSEQIAQALLDNLQLPLSQLCWVKVGAIPRTASGKVQRTRCRQLVLQRDLDILYQYGKSQADESRSQKAVHSAPRDSIEEQLARAWRQVLNLDAAGINDHFFNLGGTSLEAIALVGALRQQGYPLTTATLFKHPVFKDLAQALATTTAPVSAPPKRIADDCQRLTPDMLPLIDLAQSDIEQIAAAIPGGMVNLEDIYPLTPLQQGILFHHTLEAAQDPYRVSAVLCFHQRGRAEHFITAFRRTVERHDALRTAFLWRGLSQPVQVVQRRAELIVQSFTLAHPQPAPAQLHAQLLSNLPAMAINRAPLVSIQLSEGPDDAAAYLVFSFHHLVFDHLGFETLMAEIRQLMAAGPADLPEVMPYRNLVAQTLARAENDEARDYFTRTLGPISEPCAPYGLKDIRGDGSRIVQRRLALAADLCAELRRQARAWNSSPAALFHAAYAWLIGRCSGREAVVFGTVLSGRLQGIRGAESTVGLYINTLPIRIDLRDMTAGALLQQAQAALAQLLPYEQSSLALAQACSGVAREAPLFSALLNYRQSPFSATDHQGDSPWEILAVDERTNYPFVLSVDDRSDGFFLSLRVDASVNPDWVLDTLRQGLTTVAWALKTHSQQLLTSLPLLSSAEQRLLNKWNNTRAEYLQDTLVHQLFEAQAERQADAAALVFEDWGLSYGEFNRRSNQLAHYLMAQGVLPDTLVALCLERSLEMVIAMLAVLKAGGAYVPLDPESPPERLTTMLEDSAPRVLLTQVGLLEALRPSVADRGICPIVVLDAVPWIDCAWSNSPETNPNPGAIGLTPQHLAYVIYTSGSTGKPKGVMVAHCSLSNHIQWRQRAYRLHGDDIVLQKTPFSFDASVWEFVWPLMSGAKIVMARPGGHRDPEYLADLIHTQRVTTLAFVPSMLEVFLTRQPACVSLKRVFCGGEALRVSTVNQARRLWPHAEIRNLYGPTETTISVTVWHCKEPLPGTSIPIGNPIANTQIYLLDSQLQPVPVGVEGEIYIGGVGVARGYLNRPELTAERFLPNPFAESQGNVAARMYKTGDLGRRRADGAVEYLGRNDFQIKIRGFRVELGEIEAQLARLPGVREVVVIASKDRAGDPRLVAYWVTNAVIDPVQAREHLRAVLPEDMIPTAYVALEALPLTATGKLDRGALPAPDNRAFSRRHYEAPRGEIETAVAEIWRELLGVERVGRHDQFFELGGHSLLAVRLISRIRNVFGKDISLKTLLAKPSIANIAAAIADTATEVTPLPNTALPPRPEQIPLSFEQERMWPIIQQEIEGRAPAFNTYSCWRLTGKLNIAALGDSFQRLMERHEILRTGFPLANEFRIQAIAPNATVDLQTVGLHTEAEPQHAEELKTVIQKIVSRPFDLAKGPVWRLALLQLRADHHLLVVCLNHMIADHQSLKLIIDEFCLLYRARVSGQRRSLPVLSMQYADYTCWQRARLTPGRLKEKLHYWQQLLAAPPPPLNLAAEKTRTEGISFPCGVERLAFGGKLTRALKALARQTGTTLFSALFAVYVSFLYSRSGAEDMVVGVPTNRRPHAMTQQSIGCFSNVSLLRIDISDNPGFLALLMRSHELILAAIENQDLNYRQIMGQLGAEAPPDHPLPFRVTMNFIDAGEPSVTHLPDGLTVTAVEPGTLKHRDAIRRDLSMILWEKSPHAEGLIEGVLSYRSDLFTKREAVKMQAELQALLEVITAHPEYSIERLRDHSAGV